MVVQENEKFSIILHKNIQTASIDRKDSKIGYVKGNIQWVHKTINLMKGQLLDSEFITLCHIISKNNQISKDDKISINELKWRPNIK